MQYFSTGLHEELIVKLSMLDVVRVASRSSVSRYSDSDESMARIGQELCVDVVVEGSISRLQGDRVRIVRRVVQAASVLTIQTLQYEEDIGDALAVQAKIAEALAHQLDTDHDESVFTQTAMNAASVPGGRKGTVTKVSAAVIIAQHQLRCLPTRRLSRSQRGMAATAAAK